MLRNLVQWKFIRTSPFFDGTLSDLSNALYVDRLLKPDRYNDLIEESSSKTLGYIQMRVKDLKTRSVNDYARILDDPDLWAGFEKETMSGYFDDQIEMFPFNRREYPDVKARRSTDRTELVNPEPFHLVQKEMVERRFGKGTTENIGERDLRDAIASFRYAFVHNFWRLVISRRQAALEGLLMAFLCVVAFVAVALARIASPNWGLELVVLILALLSLMGLAWGRTRHMIQRHTEKYVDAVKASCNVLSGHLQIRLHSLSEVIPQLFHKIDRSKWQMLTDGRLDEWPTEGKKWSTLAFWLSARVEHIELLMQVQMWRIRRLHFGIRWIGRILSGLIALSAVALLGATSAGGFWLLSTNLAQEQQLVGLSLFVVVTMAGLISSTSMARMSYTHDTPDLDIIRNTLKTDTMKRFRDVKLHDQVAEHVFEQKKSQVYSETLQKR